MSEDRSTVEPPSWLERMAQVFSADPKDQGALLDQLRDARQSELLSPEVISIMEGAIEAADMQVREVMIPRSQMVCLKAEQTAERFLPRMIESGHSRFPVIGENLDEVLGILLAKDMLPFLLNPGQPIDLAKLMRPAIFVPESKRLNVLLNEFRTNRYHMAVVLDEYGGVAGLITIEDVLEQIVGDIEDETDVEEDLFIKPLAGEDFIVKALTPIEDFNEHFATDFSDEEFDTIGGILMQQFGHLPKRGEALALAGLNFKVINADNRRIRLLRVSPA